MAPSWCSARPGATSQPGCPAATAYVWRLDTGLVQPEMVDLKPVAGAEVQGCSEALVRSHAEHTGSPVAAALLARWPEAVTEFTAVIPRDYRRVVDAIRAAEAAGQDVDDAIIRFWMVNSA